MQTKCNVLFAPTNFISTILPHYAAVIRFISLVFHVTLKMEKACMIGSRPWCLSTEKANICKFNRFYSIFTQFLFSQEVKLVEIQIRERIRGLVKKKKSSLNDTRHSEIFLKKLPIKVLIPQIGFCHSYDQADPC
ncbi:hypothetical protein ACH3XW_34120 [Acanthocheilonema viteae]